MESKIIKAHAVVLAWVVSSVAFAADEELTCQVVNDDLASVVVATEDGCSTLTPTTSSPGMEFQYWYGDVDYTNRYDNPLTVNRGRPRKVYAFFGHDAANGTVVSASRSGSGAFSWFDAAIWDGGVVPGTNDSAVVRQTLNTYDHTKRFYVDVPNFFAVKDLTLSNGVVRVNSTAHPGTADSYTSSGADYADGCGGLANAALRDSIGCDIFGNLTIDHYNTSYVVGWERTLVGGSLWVGDRGNQSCSKVFVGGNLTIANGNLTVYAGYDFDEVVVDTSRPSDGPRGFQPFVHTNELFRGGNFIRVKGRTALLTPTQTYARFRNSIHVVNCIRTGAAVWLDLEDLSVANGASISAYKGGYYWFNEDGSITKFVSSTDPWYLHYYSMCPGGKAIGDDKSGGSHGGFGGSADAVSDPSVLRSTSHFSVYDFEVTPLFPGSPSVANAGVGGGTIRLDCDTLSLDGMLTANGCGTSKGGTAGGSIWVVCDSLECGENAQISAAGGVGNATGAGGGGGRVSICEGLSEEQVLGLYEEHEAGEAMSVSALAEKIPDRVNVSGGRYVGSQRSWGQDGTAVYVVNRSSKVLLTVAGDPSNIGQPEPGYGVNLCASGVPLAFTSPGIVPVSADGRTVRRSVGYEILNADGDMIQEGDDDSFEYAPEGDSTVVWRMHEVNHRLDVEAAVGGAIVTNVIRTAGSLWQCDGSSVELAAVAESGFVFAGWVGEVVEADKYEPTLAFAMDAPVKVKALFADEAAGAVTFLSPSGDWFDPANWSTGKVPGPNSDVIVPTGCQVLADRSLIVRVRSLTVAADASVSFIPEGSFSVSSRSPIVESGYIEVFDWHDTGLVASRDIRTDGRVEVGKLDSLANGLLKAGGNLTVGVAGVVNAYGGYNPDLRITSSAHWRDYGAKVVANAHLRIEGRVHVAGDGYSASPCLVGAGRLTVTSSGKLDAYNGGWFWRQYENGGEADPSPGGQFGNVLRGGAYGGMGGSISILHANNDKVYGNRLCPYMAGSPGGQYVDIRGGGALRIEVVGTINNEGLISSCGYNGEYGAVGGHNGGSGGSVFITCSRLRMDGPAAVICANGGTVTDDSGPGGGGRVLVATSISAEDVDSLYETGALLPHSRVIVVDLAQAGPSVFGIGKIEAKGGATIEANASTPELCSTDGSVVWLQGPRRGLTIRLR